MEEKRKRLTAKRKFELFLEVKQKEANVGEILRRHGVHLNDLRRIEAEVERAAIDALKGRHNGGSVSATDYSMLAQELAQKEKALAELMVEYMLLKKRDASVSKGLSKEFMFMGSGDKR
jgi:transposase-like protein